jgi:DNA polymerase IV
MGAGHDHSGRRSDHLGGCALALQPIIEKVWRYYEGSGIRGRAVTLKVKHADFSQARRSKTGTAAISSGRELEQVSLGLLEPFFPVPRGIRLLGVTLSSLEDGPAEAEAQLRLTVKPSDTRTGNAVSWP